MAASEGAGALEITPRIDRDLADEIMTLLKALPADAPCASDAKANSERDARLVPERR
jgi:hypothetical protein